MSIVSVMAIALWLGTTWDRDIQYKERVELQDMYDSLEEQASPPWPTPYPPGSGINITAEGCAEHRYNEEDVLQRLIPMWNETTKTWADDYELVQYISYVVTNSVASHNCSFYDDSYDDDYFFWSQQAYKFIEILEYRLYDEKHDAEE